MDSCQQCESCAEGLEQYCTTGSAGTYNSRDVHSGVTYGGHSTRIVVDEKFVLRIPEHLDPAAAAPLLCVGITTYSPLRHWKVGPGHKVGVIGLGGLGHMAVKLAAAMGANVVLFTTSTGKAGDAKRLGATEVVLSKDKAQMKAHANSFDFILNTVAAPHSLDAFLALLKRDATMTLVGVPGSPHPSPNVGALIFRRRTLAGSLIGSIAETQEMLDFCGTHCITADIETIRMDQINEAYERMLRSEVKYRFVIELASIMPRAQRAPPPEGSMPRCQLRSRMRKAGLRMAVLVWASLMTTPGFAAQILLVNDDGWSVNVQALQRALETAHHEVLIAVPCQNQSGKGAAVNMMQPLTTLTKPCIRDAAPVGAPAVGPVKGETRAFYVDGTPIMATLYGLDVLAPQRWKRPPDLVISGPNEGQNAGPLINSSGTVANMQLAAGRGLPAIAVSADANTRGNEGLAVEVAQLTLRLVAGLTTAAKGGPLLPAGTALNVNIPKFEAGRGAALDWEPAVQGSFSTIRLRFVSELSQDEAARAAGLGDQRYPGVLYESLPGVPSAAQIHDEAAVNARGHVSVSALQVGFDAALSSRHWLQQELPGWLGKH